VASSEPTPADMLSGASMLIDRETLRGSGGWDERFHPAVFVDIDVSFTHEVADGMHGAIVKAVLAGTPAG